MGRKTQRRTYRHKKYHNQRGSGFFNSIGTFFSRKATAKVAPAPIQQTNPRTISQMWNMNEPAYNVQIPNAPRASFSDTPYNKPKQEPRPSFWKSLFTRKKRESLPSVKAAIRPLTSKTPGYLSSLFTRKQRIQPTKSVYQKLLTRTMNQPIPTIYKAKKSLSTNENRRKKGFLQEHYGNDKSKYESTLSGQERDFVFAYQKWRRQPTNKSVLKLEPWQKSQLINAILKYIYNENTNSFTLPLPDEYDNLSKDIFGMSESDFDSELQDFEVSSLATGKIPFQASKYLSRLIPSLLRTDKEREYLSNQQKTCYISDSTTEDKFRSLQDNFCIFVSPHIPLVYPNLEAYNDAMYICVHPYYFPFEKVSRRYSNTYYGYENLQPKPLESSIIEKVSFIQDAFQNSAITLIHPRLGVLLQKERRDLWASGLFLPQLDDIDAIVLLTLQKYAAIRRYSTTKDPFFTAEVYTTDHMNLLMSYELRNPQQPSEGYTFNSERFYEEFLENQEWAGGVIRYHSLQDIHLNEFLPPVRKNALRGIPWIAKTPYIEQEQIPIPPLREERRIRQGRLNL